MFLRTEIFPFCFILIILPLQFNSTHLDDYVHDKDPLYNWTLIETYTETEYKLYILNYTSLKWYDGKLFCREFN